MNIEPIAKKVLTYKAEEKEKSLDPEAYNEMWDNIERKIAKRSDRYASFTKSMTRKNIYIAAASIVLVFALLSTSIFLKQSNNNSKVNIGENTMNNLGNKQTFGLYMPSLISFNNSVYTSMEEIQESSIGKKLGKENYFSSDVYEVLNESPEKKIAISRDNKHYLLYVVNTSPEDTIVKMALDNYSNILGGLQIPPKDGLTKKSLKINNISVPIEIETKIVDKGDFNYSILLVARWNFDNEKKEHKWNILARLSESQIISEEGDTVPDWKSE